MNEMTSTSTSAFVNVPLLARFGVRRQAWTCSRKAEDDGGASAARKRAADEMVRRDMVALKQKRKVAEGEVKNTSETKQALQNVRGAVEMLLLVDFFLVVALLLWLVVALVPHFATQNDVLLDPWLALWKPFIQPVLGVLMLGTIVQGTISYVGKND